MSKLQKLAINEEGFIFDPETGNSYTANQTALFILKLLKEKKTEQEILKILTEEFDVKEEQAKQDLFDFLEQLRIYGLIEK